LTHHYKHFIHIDVFRVVAAIVVALIHLLLLLLLILLLMLRMRIAVVVGVGVGVVVLVLAVIRVEVIHRELLLIRLTEIRAVWIVLLRRLRH